MRAFVNVASTPRADPKGRLTGVLEKSRDSVRSLHINGSLDESKLAAEDFEVHKLLAEVQHLLKPQSALREPALAKRAMALAEA